MAHQTVNRATGALVREFNGITNAGQFRILKQPRALTLSSHLECVFWLGRTPEPVSTKL